MHAPNNATVEFLLAAKRAEIASLNQLVTSCDLVTRVNDLIHELQRERGLSNVFLQSDGQRFHDQRAQQVEQSRRAESQLRDYLAQLDTERGPLAGNARLLNNIAYVLHALDELGALRCAADAQALKATESTATLSRLIAALLAVVFEAADISGDPELTRALVALFNFMQGKEYAGQERAWGALGFAAGSFEPTQLERLVHLRDSQNRCFELFVQFAEPEQIAGWHSLERRGATAELTRLRTVVSRVEAGAGLPPDISEVWYDLTTQRIDAMQALERQLSAALSQLSQHRVRQARQNLQQQHDRLQLLTSLRVPTTSPLTRMLGDETGAAPSLSSGHAEHELVRSLYDMIKTQSERLQTVNDELTEAREALRDRKRIERAKGLLMQRNGLSEEQAYRLMQQTAMTANKRLIDVARLVIEDFGRGNEPLQGKNRPTCTMEAQAGKPNKSSRSARSNRQPTD
ncbi:MAG: nitrate- and nitrite sensing domain-containing protein [Oceanospirillaceae bacterium]|nr:nitrate- and nitrite sensing domain-containing protein [Oceanospirillaceae bacterium]